MSVSDPDPTETEVVEAADVVEDADADADADDDDDDDDDDGVDLKESINKRAFSCHGVISSFLPDVLTFGRSLWAPSFASARFAAPPKATRTDAAPNSARASKMVKANRPSAFFLHEDFVGSSKL